MARKKTPPTAMARKRSPSELKKLKAAIDKCNNRIVDDYADCMNLTNPDGSYKYSQVECETYMWKKFVECMASQGISTRSILVRRRRRPVKRR
jgi:hypothetical protein